MKRKLLATLGIIIIVILGAILVIFSTRDKAISLGSNQPQAKGHTCSESINQAIKQENEGNLLGAKSIYEKLVNGFPNSAQVGNWQNKIWDLNIKLLFSPIITEASTLYEIKSGDSLAKIAKKFNTTVELIKKSNGFLSDRIITGRQIKVWTRPFNILVDKSQNILILKSNDEVVKTYIVSTGINNSTPIGKFKIVNKLLNPTWFRPGAVIPPDSPENILGSRWMGFDLADYGIHGTTEPQTLGQQITKGCVRMSNSDVEELFAIVPVGTEVVIVD